MEYDLTTKVGPSGEPMVRDPKTGQWRSKAWERSASLRGAQGKETGDFDGFSDYGHKSSAAEMGGAMDRGGAPKSYGVDEGDQ